jgi:bacterioferritin-associated ferredoxin
MATNTEQLLSYLQTPGLTDAQIASEVNRLGVTAAQVSQLTGVPIADVQSRLGTAANVVGGTTAGTVTGGGATTPTFGTTQETALYNFLQTPNLTDQQIAAEVNRLGLKADQISKMTGVPVGEINARLNLISTQTAAQAKATADAQALANAQSALAAANAKALALQNKTTTPTNTANFSTFTNWLKATPGLTDQQIAAEMNRLGISNTQVADLTGVGLNDVNTRFNAVAPFSNATQGFAQNFANYQSIPIGAQYNPAVTAGGASPYSQIMGQMKPVGNPYAGVVGNLSMGGYNPGLYDQIAAANTAKTAAADTAAAAAAAQQLDASSTGGMAQGGMVHGGLMFGANPPGPDDGAVNLDMGEYVVKKSSVDKYGKGLLDMINEGKVPAKKMKSLLG